MDMVDNKVLIIAMEITILISFAVLIVMYVKKKEFLLIVV